jgi:aspartyl-tRNA(Asn)/glutamyl-tRNA(Gln) amidotransferase subunit A
VITLKEALSKTPQEIAEIRAEIMAAAKDSDLNAYIGFNEAGEGIPILLKDNIQVNGWSVTSGSKILQGYIARPAATAAADPPELPPGTLLVSCGFLVMP